MTINFEQIELELNNIPSLPVVVTDIISNLDSHTVNFDVLERTIAQDPVITARLLAVANSSFYGFSGKVLGIKDTCLVLGVNTIRSIVITIGVIQHLERNEAGSLNHKAFWRHSLGVGIAARVLAKQIGLDAEIAFTVGVLHDIGVLVLDSRFSDEYAEVLKYYDENSCQRYEAEEKILGFEHSLVGAGLAEHWRLPKIIVSSIANHHMSYLTLSSPVVDLISIADVVSKNIEIKVEGDEFIAELDHGAMERIGLDVLMIDGCRDEIERSIASFDVLLG